jgi:integrase
MARPPLAMGTHGSISITRRAGSTAYVARCRFRDFDGVTRSLERSGRSKAAAMSALQDEIRGRTGAPAAPLRPHHTFERAAEVWLAKLDAQVTEGTRTATTADTYRQRLRSVVLPAMGQWRLRECTVPQLDAFFTDLAKSQGAQSRKTVRTVVSLILRVAVQQEAIRDNPVRHLDPIEASSQKPRALTAEERRRFLAWMQGTSKDKEEARAQASARRRDLPDFVTFMLGTGVRIGEALGVRECDLDLEGVPVIDGYELRAVPIVAITGNVVRHRGKGLYRHAGKTETSLRIVPLPRFVVDMLLRRAARAGGTGVPRRGCSGWRLQLEGPEQHGDLHPRSSTGRRHGLARHEPHLSQDRRHNLARLWSFDRPAEGGSYRSRQDQYLDRHLHRSGGAAPAGGRGDGCCLDGHLIPLAGSRAIRRPLQAASLLVNIGALRFRSCPATIDVASCPGVRDDQGGDLIARPRTTLRGRGSRSIGNLMVSARAWRRPPLSCASSARGAAPG